MSEKKVCPVCSVVIEGSVVHFKVGKPGTKERLCARVCQYINRARGCINDVGSFSAGDCYDQGQDLHYRTEGYRVEPQFRDMARLILDNLGVREYDEQEQSSGESSAEVG